MQEQPNFVERVYASSNNQELSESYDAWARTYEQDTADNWGRRDPDVGVEVFANHVSTDASILDAGAGTGLIGKLLSDRGYGNLVGIDLSEGMLEQSRAKGVYRDLRQMVMGERLDFPDDRFDAAISIGVLTQGHARPDSFDELVRVVKPGGKIAFGLRTDVYEEQSFKEKQAELEAQGKWKLVERSEPFVAMPKGQPDKFNEIWVYEVS